MVGRDREEGHGMHQGVLGPRVRSLSQGVLMNNYMLDEYEKSKNKLLTLSQTVLSEKWDKISLTLPVE